ncbi:hypothetical protein VNO77_27446 [Canavalia gladiata]|uniref:Uncharacterized protein n=1 Tax=Canavalia gladiata TaxID=3824 RepID=A0AAN9Q736_CANGL
MLSLAPAISEFDKWVVSNHEQGSNKKNPTKGDFPRSILKQSPLHASMHKAKNLFDSRILPRSNLKVFINLPNNEISLANSRLLASVENKEGTSETIVGNVSGRHQVPTRSPLCFPFIMNYCEDTEKFTSSRSILEVLREIDTDVLALQDVKAEKEKNTKPLSDLTGALGMKYVFAKSWALEYGNAISSKWPIYGKFKRLLMMMISELWLIMHVRAYTSVPGISKTLMNDKLRDQLRFASMWLPWHLSLLSYLIRIFEDVVVQFLKRLVGKIMDTRAGNPWRFLERACRCALGSSSNMLEAWLLEIRRFCSTHGKDPLNLNIIEDVHGVVNARVNGSLSLCEESNTYWTLLAGA